ncbi:AMP-binding protein [Streptomyces sp. NPDC006649]|uniref:class I adenylate-forming enzyme family protein n=1 Tax=Streptomyces sp. NPDC006649 TaxID=3156896 RepID=UPI0033B7E5D3
MRSYLWSPWRTAAADASRVAVIAGPESCTFGELTERADALGRGLRGQGLPDGCILSTDIRTGPGFFALALTALAYGYGLFPVEDGLLRSAAGPRLLSEMGVALHVTAGPARAGSLPVRTVSDESLADAGSRGSASAPRVPAGYLAFATSGTTGVPRGVPRVRPGHPYLGVAVESRYAAGPSVGPHLMANPTYHLGTLGPALYALQAGSAVVVQRHWSPQEFVLLADCHDVASTMLSPDLLVDIVVAGSAPARSLKAVFHGGAACPPAIKRAAVDLLGPVLHEFYGTSRSILTEIDTIQWLDHPGSVGRALPGITLTVERDGTPVPPGVPGEICARLRRADSTSVDDRVLRTGDLGYLDDDAYLYILGRADEQDGWLEALLEHLVRQLPGVTDVVVIDASGAGDPELICHVETRTPEGATELVQAIGVAATAQGLPVPQIVAHPRGTLPRTPSGKIRRTALTSGVMEDRQGQPQ